MPDTRDKTQVMIDTVNRYIELLSTGNSDDVAGLYADNATVEDPVGGEKYVGLEAIRGLYSVIDQKDRECELVSLRVAGNEVAFQFRLTMTNGGSGIRMEPIDVMVFDDHGKVAAMKAYYSGADITQI